MLFKANSPPVYLAYSTQEILSNTLATLVLYNTSLENSITFHSLGKALESAQTMMDILVYDNSAVSQSIVTSSQWSIQYVHDPTNPGVSKAYNSGFALAKQKGKKWLLLLDQDTHYTSDTIDAYVQSIQHHPEQGVFVPMLHDHFGMVSPFQFQFGGGKRISLQPGVHSLHDFLFHNCGLLVSLKSFERAGGYDDRFSLDFSDITFITRLRKNMNTFVLTNASGKHELASTSTTTLQDRINRFKQYVQACRVFTKDYSPHNYVSLRLLLRAMKLCWEHRSFQFIGIYLRSIQW